MESLVGWFAVAVVSVGGVVLYSWLTRRLATIQCKEDAIARMLIDLNNR